MGNLKYYLYLLKKGNPGEEGYLDRKLCFSVNNVELTKKNTLILTLDIDKVDLTHLKLNETLILESETSKDKKYAYFGLISYEIDYNEELTKAIINLKINPLFKFRDSIIFGT